ncbi:MAG: cobalamin B12-binding domain-containing protein [Planctomycetes bacterium]|nr:cobalamin B12-binding domain-containing protein [Planctomycetota bacterium]
MSSCDVLLINPPWLSKDGNIWHGIKAAMPPLGIMSIASYLEKQKIPVQLLDVHVLRLTADDLRAKFKELRPRVVGLTVMTATSIAANKIAKLAKEVLPDCTVVMGGVHAAAMPDECLRNQAVDLVVRGDGELTMHEIVRGDPIKEIRGLSYRDGTTVLHNAPSPVILDLDSLPFPAYHLIPMEKYYPALGAYKRLPAINMLMTRGCPGKCTFCNSAETTLRTRSAASVVDEIIMLKQKYGIREIQFYDDTFTVMKKNVHEFCRLMVEKKVDVTWTAFVRTDCFNPDMARAMKAGGCHQVCFGIESGDNEILKNIRKPIKDELTQRAIDLAKEVGIESRACFIFGNMGETKATMQNTLDYAMELDPDLALFNINTPYPGTQLYKWAKENGYLKTEDWSEYELSGLILKLPTISESEVLEFYKHAHSVFYRRPKVMWKRLLAVRGPRQILDLAHAFFYIVLRVDWSRRDGLRADWVNHKKEDFFDFDIDGPESNYLSFQAYQLYLPAQRLRRRGATAEDAAVPAGAGGHASGAGAGGAAVAPSPEPVPV